MLYNIQKMLHICDYFCTFAYKKSTYIIYKLSPRHHG